MYFSYWKVFFKKGFIASIQKQNNDLNTEDGYGYHICMIHKARM